MRVSGGTYRPREWSPLAERDPIPGDPAAIREEAAHLRRTAQALRDQARELRALAAAGAGGALEGAYADALRAGAADLDHRLRQTAERYEHVHSHLSAWAGELEDVQAESVALLRRAEAEATAPGGQHAGPRSPHDPGDPVAPLRRSLDRLTAHRDDRAAVHAGRIRRACDDVIADSAWERLEDRVGAVLDNAWVSQVFEAVSWVVTIVGITVLFLTPVGWVVDLVLGLTLALAAKDVLAFLTGHGSWFDIGMDALGLLTAGTGKIAFSALSRIQSATRLAAEGAAEQRATADALDDARSVLDRTYRVTSRRGASPAEKSAARRLRSRVLAAADHAGAQARNAESTRPLIPASRSRTIAFGGDHEAADLATDIEHMHSAWGEHESVRRASRGAGAWTGAFKGAYWVGSGSDLADKGFGKSDVLTQKWHLPAYDRFKDRFTEVWGSMW